MVHHSQRVTGINCDTIIKEAAKVAGFDRRSTKFNNALYFIAGPEYDSPEQVVAYAVERHAVGKGSALAEEIYKIYRKGCWSK